MKQIETVPDDGLLQNETQRLLANYSEAGDELAKTAAYIHQLESERDELLTGLEQIQSQHAELENTNHQLRSEIKDRVQNLEELRTHCANLQKQTELLESKISSLRADMDDLKASEVRYELTIANLRSCIENLTKPNDLFATVQDPVLELCFDTGVTSEDLNINTLDQDVVGSPTLFFTPGVSSDEILAVNFIGGPASPSTGRSVVTDASGSAVVPRKAQAQSNVPLDFNAFLCTPPPCTSYAKEAFPSSRNTSLVDIEAIVDRQDHSVVQLSSPDLCFSTTQLEYSTLGEELGPIDNNTPLPAGKALDTGTVTEPILHNHGESETQNLEGNVNNYEEEETDGEGVTENEEDEGSDERNSEDREEINDNVTDCDFPLRRSSRSETQRKRRLTNEDHSTGEGRAAKRRKIRRIISTDYQRPRSDVESDLERSSRSSTATIVPHEEVSTPPRGVRQAVVVDKGKRTQIQNHIDRPQRQISNEVDSGRTSIDTDKSLKKAIQDSYVKFGIKISLQFRYGHGPFDRHTVELSTSWKRRSILTQASWNKLTEMSQEILHSLPKSDKSIHVQKEKSLIQRLCQHADGKVEERSLRAVAAALHRERDHTKDESNLADFEFYSTLIVMKHVDEQEVSLYGTRSDDSSVDC